jgi:hypothetical protein
VGPTCQTPLSAPGPPGSAPFPRGCHAPRRSSALSTLSGPRAGVPIAPIPTGCPKIAAALPTPPRLTVPTALIPTAPSPGSKPTITVRVPRPSLSGRLRRRKHAHGERSRAPSHRFSSVEHRAHLPLPPPHRRTAAGHRSPTSLEKLRRRAGFSPSLSTRSSGELSPPPPCPAGSLTVVGARPPPFAPPPPLWHHRRPSHDTRSGAVTAPMCVTPSRAAQAEAGPASAGRALCPRAAPHVAVGRARTVHVGQADAVSVGHARTVHLGRAWFRPSGSRFKFSIFRIYSISCKLKKFV